MSCDMILLLSLFRALLKHDVLELEKANSLQNEDSFQSNQLQHDAATLKSDVERGCERFRYFFVFNVKYSTISIASLYL